MGVGVPLGAEAKRGVGEDLNFTEPFLEGITDLGQLFLWTFYGYSVHAARRYLHNLPKGHVFVKIDFHNAFNTIRRDAVLDAVANHLPELLPYAISSIGDSSLLRYDK